MMVIKCIEIKKSNINDKMCWKWTIYTRVLPINPYMNGLYSIVVKKNVDTNFDSANQLLEKHRSYETFGVGLLKGGPIKTNCFGFSIIDLSGILNFISTCR